MVLAAARIAAAHSARLSAVEAALKVLEYDHFNGDNRYPKCCVEECCQVCAILTRLNGALESPDHGSTR